MRESTFAGGWKTERYSEPRPSRFDERLAPKPEYRNENRSFPPPARSSGNFGGNSGNFSNRDDGPSRYSRGSRNYDGDGGPPRYGDKSSSQYNSSGPSNFSSNSGPSNFGNSGPPNYGNDGPSNFGNSGSNYGNSGPNYGSGGGPGYNSSGPNYSNSGPPPSRSKDMVPSQGPMGGPPMGGGAMRNQNFGNGPNEADIISSIHTLSQMNAQQNDIATKIISAVLSTNLMGGGNNLPGPPFRAGGFIGNPQGPPFEGQMGGFSDRNQYPPSRSSRGGPPPRHVGPPGGPSRFSRDRLRSPRISYPSSGPRPSYDKRYSLSSRSSLVKKRSLSITSPRDSSKSKRRRSISKERNDSPGKRDEDNGSSNKKERASEDKDEDSEKKDDIALAALYCHMCKHGNFASVKTYLYHLDGIKHRKTAMAFHARNEATLEYLRKNAKLANVRFGGKDPSVPSSKCTVCTAIIKESFAKHKRLLEHKVVKKFMSPTCCSRYFKTRYEMNEHRLSLPHLKKMYEMTEQQKIYLDDVKAKPGKWNHEDIVKQLIARNPVTEKHITLENIPPFDGNTFIGIKFLRAKDATLCKPCRLLLPVGIKSLETHMVSIEHYDNVMDYLREKKKRRMEAGDKKKGEGEEGDSDSDSDDENMEGTGDGTRYSRDHDREEEEEEEEEAVQAIKISDDEEEEDKDDMPFFDESAHIVLEEIGEDMPKSQPDEEPEEEEEEEREREFEVESDNADQ